MAGRKRKNGKRTKSGQLSRAGQCKIVKGNDRAVMMTELYGTNGSDAIGRAYERGLFGSGQDAKAMLDTGRAIHRAYWSWYANGPTRCTLADRSGSAPTATTPEDIERERRQEGWLNAMLDTAGKGGTPCRTLFDELVIDINPDAGPAWLDRIIDRKPMADDWGRLSCALDTLAECSGVQRMTYAKSA